MAPVFHRLDAEVEEVSGVPTDLARRLLAGEVDVAPIPSIEWARNADRLRLLPRLCVSSEGAVDSIQLISPKPIEKIRTIAVTPESATSVVLSRVLFPDASHVPLGQTADAKLLIGDAALRSAFEDPTPHHDLGRIWTERTCSRGLRETSWIESTAPSEPTHSRGSRRRRSALRAYSIDEIGARSSSPASSRAFRSVGTPCTSSTSASSR